MVIGPRFNARRRLVGRTFALLAASVGAVGLRPALADAAGGKARKADLFYQDAPKDGKACGSCRLFTPADSARGTCALVAGDVSVNGWCMGYTPRR